MKFVLVRHAEAVILGDAGTTTDFDRMLTERGTAQVRSLAESLKRVDCIPDAILTSPLVRARQTATGLAQVLSPGREPVHCDRLALDERGFKKLTREVAELGHECVFLVGHMPHLSEYASWLLGAEDLAVDFEKAAAALVKFRGEPGKRAGELKWLVPPKWFMTDDPGASS